MPGSTRLVTADREFRGDLLLVLVWGGSYLEAMSLGCIEFEAWLLAVLEAGYQDRGLCISTRFDFSIFSQFWCDEERIYEDG